MDLSLTARRVKKYAERENYSSNKPILVTMEILSMGMDVLPNAKLKQISLALMDQSLHLQYVPTLNQLQSKWLKF